MAKELIDFVLVSSRDEVNARCQQVCEDFGYSFEVSKELEQFLDKGEPGRVVLADCADSDSKEAAAEFSQAIRFKAPHCFLICVVSDRLDKEGAAFIKRSGASLILLQDELMNTSKFEYACTQTLKAEYLPVKTSDFAPGKPVPFGVYGRRRSRRMPLSLDFRWGSSRLKTS